MGVRLSLKGFAVFLLFVPNVRGIKGRRNNVNVCMCLRVKVEGVVVSAVGLSLVVQGHGQCLPFTCLFRKEAPVRYAHHTDPNAASVSTSCLFSQPANLVSSKNCIFFTCAKICKGMFC